MIGVFSLEATFTKLLLKCCVKSVSFVIIPLSHFMPKVFSVSLTLPFIPNSLNNFQIVLGSDFPSSNFDWYVSFIAISISFVTLLRSSFYAEVY